MASQLNDLKAKGQDYALKLIDIVKSNPTVNQFVKMKDGNGVPPSGYISASDRNRQSPSSKKNNSSRNNLYHNDENDFSNGHVELYTNLKRDASLGFLDDNELEQMQANSQSNNNYGDISNLDEDEIERIKKAYARLTPDFALHKKILTLANNGGVPGGPDIEVVGPHWCSSCCLMFSIVAVVILTLVAWTFYYCGIYMKLPPQSTVTHAQAGDNALGAAGVYCLCAVVSGHYYYKGLQRLKEAGARRAEGKS